MNYLEIVTYINTWVNPIAILITIILFIIFIFGKIITSTRGRWDSTEVLLYNPSEELIDDLSRVYQYEDEYVEGTILLRSDETLYDVKLYNVEVSNKFRLSRKGKILTVPNQDINYTKIKKLKPSEGLLVKVSFPCGIPEYALTWYKYNYMKATYYFGYDGKNGFKDRMTIEYKKTWRTYLYNFVK